MTRPGLSLSLQESQDVTLADRAWVPFDRHLEPFSPMFPGGFPPEREETFLVRKPLSENTIDVSVGGQHPQWGCKGPMPKRSGRAGDDPVFPAQ